MIIHTYNSTYEVDEKGQRIRRLHGSAPATNRFSEDNRWWPYASIGEPHIGQSLLISWPDGQPELRDHTVTSAVTAVER